MTGLAARPASPHGLDLFAPPFCVGFYAACAIGRVSLDAAMGRVWPYLGALFLALIIVALVPYGRFDSE